jgi:Fe-S-cluster containining protein
MTGVLSDTCTECLACCHDLVVRCTKEDVQREPRIIGQADAEEGRKSYRLCPREIRPGRFNYTCPFLRGWGCEIYDTRPAVCRRFTRGSPECRQARKRNKKEAIRE